MSFKFYVIVTVDIFKASHNVHINKKKLRFKVHHYMSCNCSHQWLRKHALLWKITKYIKNLYLTFKGLQRKWQNNKSLVL